MNDLIYFSYQIILDEYGCVLNKVRNIDESNRMHKFVIVIIYTFLKCY